jgi:DNA replicative helicase MCM subunit Mcm2 (Cdc46/Mcm family)
LEWEVRNYRIQIKLRRYIDMADKVLTCKDCGAEFTFTEGEQAFYKEKGFENEPQRCPDCRRAKKQQRNNFNKGGNRGGNRW